MFYKLLSNFLSSFQIHKPLTSDIGTLSELGLLLRIHLWHNKRLIVCLHGDCMQYKNTNSIEAVGVSKKTE